MQNKNEMMRYIDTICVTLEWMDECHAHDRYVKLFTLTNDWSILDWDGNNEIILSCGLQGLSDSQILEIMWGIV